MRGRIRGRSIQVYPYPWGEFIPEGIKIREKYFISENSVSFRQNNYLFASLAWGGAQKAVKR